MGCFDSNCGLSGLPIQAGDNVRAAIIMKPPGESFRGGSAGRWQFWTPPVLSKYNDYGSIEWDEIPADELPILDLHMGFLLPGLKDNEEYSRKIFENATDKLSNEDLWTAIIRHDLSFDPNRDKRNQYKNWLEAGKPEDQKPDAWYVHKGNYPVYVDEPMEMAAWMCHEWAWEAVKEMCPLSDRNKEELALAGWTSKTAYEYLYQKYNLVKGEPWPEEAEEEKFKIANRDLLGLYGDQGAFCRELRFITLWSDRLDMQLHDAYIANKEKTLAMYANTLQVVRNMYLIRRVIHPLSICGMQHEDFSKLLPWTQLVASKAKAKVEEWNNDHGYGDENEEEE